MRTQHTLRVGEAVGDPWSSELHGIRGAIVFGSLQKLAQTHRRSDVAQRFE